MSHRRKTYTLAAAAGGLLGGAFLPVAVAFADSTDAAVEPAAISYDLDGKETITGLYNMTTAPPGVNESLQGYGLFDAVNSDGTQGSFYAYDSTAPYLTPYLSDANSAIVSSQVLYVDSAVPGGSPDADFYPDGTVLSVTHSGDGFFENVYSAIPGASPTGDTVNDTLVTPFGNIDLTNLVVGLGFDAADVKAALPDGFAAAADTPDPTVNAVNGLPPLTIAEQGTQQLTYNGSDPFSVVETTTRDGLGFHTEAFLVTDSDVSAVPNGTVYNVIDYANLSNVYSSIPGAGTDGADKVTDILYSSSGQEIADLSWLFAGDDASAGLLDGSNLQDIMWAGNTVSAIGDAEQFTGVNGLPPGNESVQGIDLFNYTDGANSVNFTGDVTTIPDMSYSNYAEAILVTGSADTSVLPDGSIIDLTTYGNGWESIYTDMPGLGTGSHDLITDTLVNTATGTSLDLSWLYQSLDASAGLQDLAHLVDTSWLTEFFPQAATVFTEWMTGLGI